MCVCVLAATCQRRGFVDCTHLRVAEVRTPWFGTTGLPCTAAAATRNRASVGDLNHSLWPLTSAKPVQCASVFSRYSSGVICCCQHTHVWCRNVESARLNQTWAWARDLRGELLQKNGVAGKGRDVDMLPAAHTDIHESILLKHAQFRKDPSRSQTVKAKA